MAEYDRIQKRQDSRAIANQSNKRGIAQLKDSLVRNGNTTSPRMQNLRRQELDVILDPTEPNYVMPGQGGISTFKVPNSDKNWHSKLVPDNLPQEIFIRNDHDDHYSWEPRERMLLNDYQAALTQANTCFVNEFGTPGQ